MLFNCQDFFECHEVLENLWRQTKHPDLKLLYQGILQIGVGFYHLKIGNYTGAKNLVSAGIEKLGLIQPHQSFDQLIQLDLLLEASKQALIQLETLGADRLAHFPQRSIPRIQYR